MVSSRHDATDHTPKKQPRINFTFLPLIATFTPLTKHPHPHPTQTFFPPFPPKLSFPHPKPTHTPTQIPPRDHTKRPLPTPTNPSPPPQENITHAPKSISHITHNSTINCILGWLCLHSHPSACFLRRDAGGGALQRT